MREITEPVRDDAGVWQYPETWGPEDRAAHQGLTEELAAEERRLAKLEGDAKASADSPAAKLAAQRAKLAETKRAREAAEREAADEKAWAELEEKHNGRLARIYTEGGSIILRGMTEKEVALIQARVDGLVESALDAKDPKRAAADSIKGYQEGVFRSALVHPDVEKARAILSTFPGAWNDVYAARDLLNRGRREALGKGDAR